MRAREISRGWYRYRCALEHNLNERRRPWRVVVERHFVGWQPHYTHRFRTREKAERYIERWYQKNSWTEAA